MKSLMIIILILSSQSFGWSLKEVVARDTQNQLVRSFQAQCQTTESFCQDLCGKNDVCEVSRDSCDACISDSDLVTRSIILDSNRIYEIKKEIVRDESLIPYFKSQAFYVMSATSLVNIFSDPQNPADDQALRKDLQSICPASTVNPLILIDGANPQEWSPVAIVCDNESRNSEVFSLTLRAEFSTDTSSLRKMNWQTLAYSPAPEGLVLKMSTEIKPVPKKAIKFKQENGGLKLQISKRLP